MFQSLVRGYLVISRLSNAVTLNFGVRSFFKRYLHWQMKKQCKPRSYFGLSDEERDEVRVQCLFDLIESRGMMNNEAIDFYSLLHIQSVYRGYTTRRDVKFMHLSATKIQQTVRSSMCGKTLHYSDGYEEIQGVDNLHSTYMARIQCQVMSIVRRCIAQKHTMLRQQAALQIERNWRGYWARGLCCRRMTSVIRAQSVTRCIISKLAYARQRKAIIIIQSKIRQMSSKRSVSKTIEAVVKIQSIYRGHTVQLYSISLATSATCIQSFVRKAIARKSVRNTIQRAITARAMLIRIQYRRAAMKIQISYRNRLQSRHHQYATIIQRFGRGFLSRRQYVLVQKLSAQSNTDRSNAPWQRKVERTSPLPIECALGDLTSCNSMHGNDGIFLDNSSVASKTHKISTPYLGTEGSADKVFRNDAIHKTQGNALAFNLLTSISHASDDDESVDCIARLQFQQSPNNQKKEQENKSTMMHAAPPFRRDTNCEITASDLSSQSKCGMNAKPHKSSTNKPVWNYRQHDLKENKSPQTLNSSPVEVVVVDGDGAHLINGTSSSLPSLGNEKETEFQSQHIFRPLSQHTSGQNQSDSLNKEEVHSTGVHTRSKVSIFRSLENAKPASDKLVVQTSASSQQNDLARAITRSRSSSFDIDCTVKALEVVENSHRMSDVKEALDSLDRTTKKSKYCCQYFMRLKGEIALCFLITTCNRSAPHLQLIHMSLQVLTNVSKHQSTVIQLAKQEVVEVILYACQMFRDKSKLLAMSSCLLNRVLKHGDRNVMMMYTTTEQKMRINGILSLCKKRSYLDESNDLVKGIACLENVIQILNQFSSRKEPTKLYLMWSKFPI
eukprot:scaffold8889_cov74-Cyclotella_meneghiniana.AAC.2